MQGKGRRGRSQQDDTVFISLEKLLRSLEQKLLQFSRAATKFYMDSLLRGKILRDLLDFLSENYSQEQSFKVLYWGTARALATNGDVEFDVGV